MRRKLFNFLTSAAIVLSLLSLTSCNKYNKVTQLGIILGAVAILVSVMGHVFL